MISLLDFFLEVKVWSFGNENAGKLCWFWSIFQDLFLILASQSGSFCLIVFPDLKYNGIGKKNYHINLKIDEIRT